MTRIDTLIPLYCVTIPDQLDPGVIYISNEFGTAIHLCACGCGHKTVTPLKPDSPDGWALANIDGLVAIRQSIGNFSGERPYHAHYYITNNKIEWQ